jgi:DNA-binding IscR family transcriptional regulator
LQFTLARALDAFLKVLDGQTLADLLQPRARLMKIFRATSAPR